MRPDVFDSVHKGIRKALFELCLALGRAGDDPTRADEARRRATETLRFVRHHGENEDLLLLPLLEVRAPACYARMRADHAAVGEALDALETALRAWTDGAASLDLYHRACDFTARYLGHMRDEEVEILPIVVEVLSGDELVAFGRQSVARTAPADQLLMLGYMLPAMTRADGEAFLGRVPPAAAERLRPLIG